jgi:deoxyribodipyrimidine photo-lyase
MASEISLFWFRRDMRLHDNAALYHALREGKPVVPIFIFDIQILDALPDKQDRRVQFIHHTLTQLQADLTAMGSSLQVAYGKPLEVFARLTELYPVKKVFCNHDYEPYALERDAQVAELLKSKGIAFETHKDQVIFEKDEVLSGQGKPYTVFTPYSRKWKEQVNAFYLQPYPTEKYFGNFYQQAPLPVPSLEEMGFVGAEVAFPPAETSDALIRRYAEQRDFPAIQGTTRLSVHLRFGTVSIRQLAQKAQQLSESWLNELIWRDFYMNILHHFPHVATRAFKPDYDRIDWRNNEEEFARWCQGQTGYPIVDAGMRELNQTGFMHNRVRMITASFLVKHLLIDWRWGEAYFAQKLLDFDLSANNGGWQWAAGSGCDAAPYFRVFNPTLQTQKFDKDLRYIKKWVPELSSLKYPQPMVEHSFARERALATYKKALSKPE